MSSAEIVAAVDQFLAGALNGDRPAMRAAVRQMSDIDRGATCYREAEAVRSVVAALVHQVTSIVEQNTPDADKPRLATFRIVQLDDDGSAPPAYLVALGRILSCASNGHHDEIDLHLEHLEPEDVSEIIGALARLYYDLAKAGSR